MCPCFLHLLFASPQARPFGQDDPPAKERRFSKETGAIVLSAQHPITKEDHLVALVKLQEAAALPNLNAYEKSVIYQMQGATYYELGQFDNAIAAFDLAASSGGLLPNELKMLRMNTAQLLIAGENYEQGAVLLEQLYAEDPNMDILYVQMLWQTWSQTEQYGRALPWAELWLERADPKERKHYDALNFLYRVEGMPVKQAEIVKQMITRWPEDELLWHSWAMLLAESGRVAEANEIENVLAQKDELPPAQLTERLLGAYSRIK